MSGKAAFQKLDFVGVNSDLPSNTLPPNIYSDVFNMEPWDVGMRSILGSAPAFGTPLFPPEYIGFNRVEEFFYWLYTAETGIGVYNGVIHSDISNPGIYTGKAYPTVWTHGNLNGLMVFSNDNDEPFWWDNLIANPIQALPGWPSGQTCKSIRAYNYNLIAMNISNAGGHFENLLQWSNSADPGSLPDSWDPLPSNDAGSNTLSDTPGEIIDGIQYRDSFMIFKEDSTYTMQYVGGHFVFNFRKLFTTIGLLAANCAAEYLGHVFVLGDGDVVRTDGQNAESLIDKRMRSWLFKQMDTDNYRNSFVVAYHSNNQVWICFPEIGHVQPNLALVWDGSNNTFGVRDIVSTPHISRGQVGNVTRVPDWDNDGDSWDTDPTFWNQPLFNPTEDSLLKCSIDTTELIAINEGTLENGEIIHSIVERVGLDFGAPLNKKLIKSIVLRIYGNTGILLKVTVGAAQTDAGVVEWQPSQNFTVGVSSQKINVFSQGRFVAFRIESETDQTQWGLTGVEFEYAQQGVY